MEPKYVIGIGASAGGLEAIQSFFDHIPEDLDVSFVIIQHLAPDFESKMPELLRKHTKMAIHTAEIQQALLPNHIYLIPPSKNLIIKEGKLITTEREEKTSVNYSIDTFLHSLGLAYKSQSIGVILSGTGTDGTRGIRTIKEEGGIVLVQDPKTARFDGMPLSAIATDLPDLVAPSKSLANQVASIVTNELSFNGLFDGDKEIEDFSYEEFENLLHFLLVKTGIDFRLYKRNTLTRRLIKRIQVTNFNNLANYFSYLVSKNNEIHILAREFLIGVTQFFRDKEAFDFLETSILPRIFSRTDHEEIRVWCAGCSTGEEAYSLAMLFLDYREKIGINRPIKIFASDVNSEAIRKASIGKYGPNIVADISLERLEKYFNKGQNYYEVKKEPRNIIVFARHNVLKDPPFINLDLATCRNLLIYLDNEVQKTYIEKIQYSLRPNGFLMLGSGESVRDESEVFECLNLKHKLYQKKDLPQAYKPSFLNLSYDPVPTSQNQMVQIESKPNLLENRFASPEENEFSELVLNHYAPRAMLCNQDLSVLHITEQMDQLIKIPSNPNRFNLIHMFEPKTLETLKAGVHTCLEKYKPQRYQKVGLRDKNGQAIELNILFAPLWHSGTHQKLVLLEFSPPREQDASVLVMDDPDTITQQKIQSLQIELKETKFKLKNLIERYENSQEELRTTNEELLSSNEELQSGNEELQSVNEELHTVNAELKAKIDEITATNNDLDNLMKSTEIGTIFLDTSFRIRKYTPSIEEHFPIRKNDLGRSIFDFNSDIDLIKYREELLSILRIGKALEFNIQDLKFRHWLMKITPFINESSEIKGIVISFIDVSQLREAEELLRESEKRFRTLADSSPVLIWVANAELKRVLFNTPWLHFTGVESENSLIDNWLNTVHPEDRGNLLKVFHEAAQEKQAYKVNYRILDPQQGYRWILENGIPRFGKDKVFLGYVGSCVDFTEEKLAKEQLTRSNSELEQFAYVATHDLRAPVSNLKNLFELFRSQGFVNEENQAILQRLEISTNEIHDTLHDLISIVSLKKDLMEHMTEVSFSEIFQQVKLGIEEMIQKSDAQIETDFSEVNSLQYIPNQLKSIIQNLITNAIKYCHPDRSPHIQLKSFIDHNYICLSIKDNGIGISDNHKNKIFGLFQRIEEGIEGKGIGLYITKSQVESLGGKIEVESVPGIGSTFILYLLNLDLRK